MARVLFTYSPAHEDELALREVGAMVTIISKTCPDPGWYLGELDGKRGLIPDNFVEIVRLPASSTTESHKNMPASTVSVVSSQVFLSARFARHMDIVKIYYTFVGDGSSLIWVPSISSLWSNKFQRAFHLIVLFPSILASEFFSFSEG